MHRYFFHVRQGDALFEDREGGIFADIAKAGFSAADVAREITEQRALAGPITDQSIEIANEDGETVASLPFTLLLELVP
jgi:hypothetical protein